MANSNIFIVDNDTSTTQLLSSALGVDFNISLFANAEDALVALQHSSPEVIIFEYQLPGMTGIDFFEKIQEKKSLLIMMSSLDDGNMVLKFIQKGVRNYIMKDEVLVDSVKEVLQDEL
jgi:two-component system alkaline phosphatase synthesis response regulator PhoP